MGGWTNHNAVTVTVSHSVLPLYVQSLFSDHEANFKQTESPFLDAYDSDKLACVPTYV